jgi:hypothetical protein
MGALVRPAPTAAASNREDQMRDQIGQFLNIERTNRDLAALPIDVHLQSQAQAWSERNRDAGCETSCHSTHDEGEILAWGGANARAGKLVVAWMQSPSHRNILLYPDSTAMGIGVACASNGEAYATVQFYDVHRPVPPSDEQPIASSDAWGTPCDGMGGPVPPTSTSTPTTSRSATTNATPTTAAPRPRATTTTAPPRQHVAPPTTAMLVAAAPPLLATTTTSPATSTTSPRIALRADGSEIAADGSVTSEEASAFAESAATPANAEPAWVAIVVVVLLLSGMRIGAQLQELRAARRLEDG